MWAAETRNTARCDTNITLLTACENITEEGSVQEEEEEEEEEEGGSAEVSPAESAAVQEGKPSEEMKFTQSVSDLNDVIFCYIL